MEHEKEVTESHRRAAPPQEIKTFRTYKWHLATLLLILVIIIQVFLQIYLFLDLHSYYISQRIGLESEFDSLRSTCESLQISLNLLQSNYYRFLSGYADLRNQINMRAPQLGGGSDVRGFITPNDTAVENTVLQMTAGWSTISSWSDLCNDGKKMYDWVVANISYRHDGLFPILPLEPSGNIEYVRDMWQFSNETLILKEGDCDDMATLLTSMMLSYGGEKYGKTECILIEGSLGVHVAVQMLTAGDKLTILDPAGHYYTQTPSGNIDCKDISTEINNWLNYWKPIAGSDVCVKRVFSNSIDEGFSSTSEYVSWMFNR
jgi:hypothetical protein